MIEWPWFVSLPLFFAAFIGHGALLTFSHNQFYGRPLARRTTDVIQLLHALALVGGPIVLWWLLDRNNPVAIGYMVVCWLVCFVALPWNTYRRLSRGTPACVLREQTKVIDVEKELGFKPFGDGKYRRAAKLPWNEIYQVAFVERELRLPRIPPAWDGLKILHLTDLHWCGTPARPFFEYVLDRCREIEPDLLVFTGDLVDTQKHHRWILPLFHRLRWTTAGLAIMGNHDLWYKPERVRRRLRRLGFHVLTNEWIQLQVRGQPLIVVGNEQPWIKTPIDLTGCPADAFRLCLSHTPDNMPWARKQRIDLMLSGHVHGGQICLPIFGPIVMPSTFGRWYDSGVFQEEGTVLQVNRGLSGKHPLRYGCRPEVTTIILRSLERP